MDVRLFTESDESWMLECFAEWIMVRCAESVVFELACAGVAICSARGCLRCGRRCSCWR
jgi:hypothetical protein